MKNILVKKNGQEFNAKIKTPGKDEIKLSNIAYNKAFREALENGAILKIKLRDFLVQQGVWDDTKEAKYKELVKAIQEKETVIKSGGISLKKARDIAISLAKTRAEFRELIGERQSAENNCAETVADNARFNSLTSSCLVREDNGQRVWNTMEDYELDAAQEWAVEAASQLASQLYGLDPDYEKNLPENKFLIQYKFTNEKLQLINKDGHTVDEDGRLIDDEGYYIKYVDGVKVRITKDGEELDENNQKKIEFMPFLDDENNPINLE